MRSNSDRWVGSSNATIRQCIVGADGSMLTASTFARSHEIMVGGCLSGRLCNFVTGTKRRFKCKGRQWKHCAQHWNEPGERPRLHKQSKRATNHECAGPDCGQFTFEHENEQVVFPVRTSFSTGSRVLKHFQLQFRIFPIIFRRVCRSSAYQDRPASDAVGRFNWQYFDAARVDSEAVMKRC
jgi:hypothetical protein